MFVTSDNDNETIDQDISNNMSTLHINIETGAGTNCINTDESMIITHGEITPIYIDN